MALPLQRFPSIVATSGATNAAATLRGLTGGGRALNSEEVLALLKQQSLRMAASQLKSATGAAQIQPRDPTTAIAQIQLRTEGATKATKQQLSAAIMQSETAKLIAGVSTAASGESTSQLKVEMVDPNRPGESTQKSQTIKLVPATVTQAKPPTAASTTPIQQLSPAQFQPVNLLALQQAAATAKTTTINQTAPPAASSTPSSTPSSEHQ